VANTLGEAALAPTMIMEQLMITVLIATTPLTMAMGYY
jgi:hypothetical protein